MRILSWNIQAGRGTDNIVSIDRIAQTITEYRYPDGQMADVICLQEVTQGFPDLTAGAEMDQVAELSRNFPEYQTIFRPAVDMSAQANAKLPRWNFGCLVLSRYPVMQAFNHLLTQRGLTGKGMQRQALEVVLETPRQALRLMTTHLEFNSQECRTNQVDQIRALQHEVSSRVNSNPLDARPGSPYRSINRPRDLVLCGDFNLLVDSPEYEKLTRPTGSSPGLIDAWKQIRPKDPHLPTCGCDDPIQWPQGPHCRDYFFVTHELSQRLAWIDVDIDVRASDHQPIFMMLEA